MPDPEEKTEDTNVDDKKVSDDTSTNKGDDKTADNEPTEAALKIQTEFDKKLAEEEAAELAGETEKKTDDKTEDDKKTDDEKKADDEKDSAGKSDDSKKTADDKKDDSSSDKSDSADDKSKLSDELIEAAVRVGMTLKEVNAFTSDEDLQKSVVLLRKRQADSADSSQEKDDGKNKDDKSSDKSDDEKKGDAEDKPFDSKSILTELGYDPKEYDDGVIKLLDKIGQAQLNASKVKGTVGNKEVEELKATVKTLQDNLQNEAVVRYFKAFDGRIDVLGKDWTDIFGKGSGPELKDDSDGLKNRTILDKEIQVIAIGRDSAGLKPLSEQAMFDKALESAFPEKSKTLSGKKVSDKLKDRANQNIHKPSGQKGAEKTGHEKALQANIDFDKKLAEEESNDNVG